MSRENTLHLGKCSPVALLFVLQTKEVSQPHDLAQAGSLAPTKGKKICFLWIIG